MKRIPVRASWDVPAAWRDGPFGDLLSYQNMGMPHRTHEKPTLLVAACFDPRVVFRWPAGFTFSLRVPGANLALVPFGPSYAFAVKRVRHAAVIAHTDCGAMGLLGKRAEVVRGLTDTGWDVKRAEAHFDERAPLWNLPDPGLFAIRQAKQMATDYPKITTAAFLYDLADGGLSILEE